MQINLDEERLKQLEQDGFSFKYSTIANDPVILITPKGLSADWNKDNMIFRSSVWTTDGRPVSLSFKKFFNLSEKPDLVPDPTEKQLHKAMFPQKIDGSTLIVSHWKWETIIRTRGTFDATTQDNGYEIEILKKKYPKAFAKFDAFENCSLIFEWVSDVNKIVIAYPDCPDMKLIGVVNHDDYTYMSQKDLDRIAEIIEVPRPSYANFTTMEEMMAKVQNLKDEEGYCIYYNDEQDIKKVKSPWYLTLHRFKSNCTLESVLDLYMDWEEPLYPIFCAKIGATYDYECLTMALPLASKVAQAKRQVDAIVSGMHRFVDEKLKPLATRKEQAKMVLSSYGGEGNNRAGFVFLILDGKPLDKDARKKLYWQCLKG